jgi:hypothetical protein
MPFLNFVQYRLYTIVTDSVTSYKKHCTFSCGTSNMFNSQKYSQSAAGGRNAVFEGNFVLVPAKCYVTGCNS